MILRKLLVCFVVIGLLTACSSNDKPSYQANTIQTIMVGTVESVEIVNVDGNSSWIGSTGGSIAGGLLGSTIGSGWGRVATSIIGSVAGSFAGSGAERQLTKGEGLRMAVREDSGSVFTVVTVPENSQTFKVGDKVRVVSNTNGAVKVDLQQ